MNKPKTTAEVEPLRQLQVLLRKEMNHKQDNLVNAPAVDFADYKYRIGVIHGLAIAEGALLELDTTLVEQ